MPVNPPPITTAVNRPSPPVAGSRPMCESMAAAAGIVSTSKTNSAPSTGGGSTRLPAASTSRS